MQADTHSILLPQHMMMSVRKCAHESQLPEVKYSHVRQGTHWSDLFSPATQL